MKIKAMHGFFIVLIGLCGVTAAFACSPPPTSMYKNYTEHAKVFLGTVQQKSALGEDTYDVRVDEAFKGFPDENKLSASIPVAFNIRGQCGFDAPKPGSRVLVFMNDGDVVSSASGSSFIWREAEQSEAHLNPVLDNIVILRRMLGFRWSAVPDEETAVHLAMKAMIPVFGKEAVSKNKPYSARFQGDKPTIEERVWHVEGTLHCDDSSKRCRGRVLRASINKWTGDLIRVSAGD